MSEYQRHMENIRDMNGWSPVSTAPCNYPVTVMDHAGNLTTAVLRGDGWVTHTPYSSIMDGQKINAVKWKS